MRTLVSLDIETTGLDPDRDAILEIGLVRFRGDEVQREWSALINPGRPIPPKITELTHITDEMVRKSGISLWDALREVERIAGNAPIIGHNISFDLAFMRRQRSLIDNEGIDTFELAAILVPHAGRYSLGALAKELGIELKDAHRALDDARAAKDLYLRISERAAELPKDTLEEIVRHAEKLGWPLAPFWREALEQQARGAFTGSIGSRIKTAVTKTGQNTLARKAARRNQALAKPLQPRDESLPLDPQAVGAILGEGGALAQRVKNYEVRPQQIAMASKVSEAFNNGEMALIEAGTGTGKSFAYLIPSMMWAMQNGQRVVVSTNTINLQEQLLEKDVPLVAELLTAQLPAATDDTRRAELMPRAAVMKGKARYICPNRVSDLRKNGPRSVEEARLLTKILIWLPNTITGDADELFVPAPAERMAMSHLTAASPACSMNTCSATDCFFFQARRLAESAHVVIVNHALLLADIAVENRALPEYKYLVLDEGHHLEAAATDSLTFAIDREDIGRMLDELARGADLRKKGAGALGEVVARARGSLPVDKAAAFERACEQGVQSIIKCHTVNAAFWDQLADFLAQQTGGDGNEYISKVRITRAVRNSAGWGAVESSFDNLLQEMTGVTRVVNGLIKGLGEASEEIEDLDLLLARLTGAGRFFTDAIENMNGIISKADDKDRIYWADVDMRNRGMARGRSGNARIKLSAAPLHVGGMLEKQLWQGKESVVLTSATMRTATPATKNQPSFNYITGRLNARDAVTMAVDSPFDYKANTLVFLPTDMPEPNQPGYQQALDRALIDFFKASQGRGLALFTSHTGLRTTARSISVELQRAGVTVFEQADGVSRRSLLEQFRAAERGVLLGTKSFWEGVDIQGEQLSALAICKLPFDVPSDPIFAARSETFDDAFNEFSVPETVLRFRQGFGRLIRSKTDRGVVAVLDKRVTSKGYGQAFLNSLPGPTTQRAPLAQLGPSTAQWLSR